jgi:YbbR domain-containing protein
MKQNIKNILNYIKVVNFRNNNRMVVFLICLIIATTLWLLNALSKDYSATISYPVKFENPPENRFLAGEIPNKLELNVDAQGFTLLRHKLFAYSPVTLDIEEITRNMTTNTNIYRVTSQNLITRIEDQLSNELSITYISPEILVIVMDSLSAKTIPVELDINVDYEQQYYLKSPISIYPDSVEITGPTIILNNISVLKTKVNIANKLNTSFHQEIELIHPDKTTISPSKITLKIDVEKYTEKELKIPVEILNKPENTSMKLFPSELKIVFTVGLSRFESISASDFGVSVDYNSINNEINNLDINLYKVPDFIQGIRLIPERVEFLIETN